MQTFKTIYQICFQNIKKMDNKGISKLLSFVLRHNPQSIDLQLDANGWANVKTLLEKLKEKKRLDLSMTRLREVVATNDKKRFAFDEDELLIRANQGHSIEIDLALSPTTPPEILYHGTASCNQAAITAEGIKKGERQHVHLSATTDVARQVGKRHGSPVVCNVEAARMVADGFLFYKSENGVWLTDFVPPKYLKF